MLAAGDATSLALTDLAHGLRIDGVAAAAAAAAATVTLAKPRCSAESADGQCEACMGKHRPHTCERFRLAREKRAGSKRELQVFEEFCSELREVALARLGGTGEADYGAALGGHARTQSE